MDKNEVFFNLKELILDFVNGYGNREETTLELRERINAEDVFELDDALINTAYWAIAHLSHKGHETTTEKMSYLADCFEGKKTFSKEDWEIL